LITDEMTVLIADYTTYLLGIATDDW